MVEKRSKPRVWATWLAAYLSGEEQCDWKLWFKSHHRFSRPPRDLADWETQHSQMVNKYAGDLKSKGFVVTTEQQNEFVVEGKRVDLAGKPDIIAKKEKIVYIIDCKTGDERTCHKVQVLLYLWALSKNPKYRGVQFHGEVFYKDGTIVNVSVDQLTKEFEQRLSKIISTIVDAPSPPQKKPSLSECRFCDIPVEHCQEKMSVEPNIIKTDLF